MILGSIILAGGRSRRMGRPKESLPFAGSTLLGHTVDVLLDCTFPVVVVARDQEQELPPIHLEADLVFDHRLEMLRVYRPWIRSPIALWKRAFLHGYGRADAESSPMYRALMIRHLLCRLLTYVRRPPANLKQWLHYKWVRWRVRERLVAELAREQITTVEASRDS